MGTPLSEEADEAGRDRLGRVPFEQIAGTAAVLSFRIGPIGPIPADGCAYDGRMPS
jgi:hypothetical protein